MHSRSCHHHNHCRHNSCRPSSFHLRSRRCSAPRSTSFASTCRWCRTTASRFRICELEDFKVAIDGHQRRIVSAELVQYSQRPPDAAAPVVPIRTPGPRPRRQPAVHPRRRSAGVFNRRADGVAAGDSQVRRAAAARRHGRAVRLPVPRAADEPDARSLRGESRVCPARRHEGADGRNLQPVAFRDRRHHRARCRHARAASSRANAISRIRSARRSSGRKRTRPRD